MARDARPLEGAFAGWTQHGGGAQYSVHGEIDGHEVVLYYDIAGSAIGKARNSACSGRPWTVQVDRRLLRDYGQRKRIFGSKETARAAAEKQLREAN